MKFVELFNLKLKRVNNVFCTHLPYIYSLNMNNGVGTIYIYNSKFTIIYPYETTSHLTKVGSMLS